MTQGFVEADGARLEYVWHGPKPGDAPTLIFLHEGLGCVTMWRDFPERVAAATGCGALVYSRRGYGKSDGCDWPRPVSFMHDEAIDSLPEVISGLGLKDYIFVGHSDGASIALINAGKFEQPGLKGVIVEAPHVFVEQISVDSIAEIKTIYETTDLPEKLARHHGGNTECAFRGWNEVWLVNDFRQWNIEEYLPSIGVPLQVIQGVNDEYGTAAQVDAIADKAGGAVETVMLDDCGHSPHRDQPDAVVRAMTAFVDQLR